MPNSLTNQPETSGDFKSLKSALEEKNINVVHFIGNLAYDRNDRYAYYLTPELKFMRVETSWVTISTVFSKQEIHWDTATEI
jgi:hypothetical protein